MKSRDFLIGTAAVAALVAAAVALLLLHGSGHSTPASVQAPAPSVSSCPTAQQAVGRTLDGAISQAEQIGAAFYPGELVYLSYANSTFREARNAVDPQHFANVALPDDAAVWFFVASVPPNANGSSGPGATHSTAFVIIPKTCGPSTWQGFTDQQVDLRLLGRAVQLPGPLPTVSLTPPPSPTARPWPTPVSLIANTLDDAIRLTAFIYTGHGNTLSIAQPESVSYVETTASHAESMFEPGHPGVFGMPANAPVWVFVAHGKFGGQFCMGCQPHANTPIAEPTAILATTAWVVVVRGARLAFQDGYSDQQYDLSPLGTPVQLDSSQWNKY